MSSVATSVGVPSTRGMSTALGDFGVGAIGGAIYSLSSAIFGSGFIGALISIVLAGSMIKGTRGTALAAVAGFMAFSSLFAGGMPTSVASAAESVQEQVM